MKTRIREREAEIKNMRAAKSEFSFHLSQSLLKTINNLNLQVLDLKQNDLVDDFKFTRQYDGPNVDEIIDSYMQRNLFFKKIFHKKF